MATKLRRSLFIGLGGTGMKTILKTKSVLLDNYGQDGELPPFFAFLGIDTDCNEYENTAKSKKIDAVSLSARERFSISVSKPKEFFENRKREMTWMPHQNKIFINTLDRGAGQIRSNGRLAFMYNRERLKERLRAALTDVKSAESYTEKWKNYSALESGDDGNASIEVHVVFSLSGGTGCGTFLDVAYLLREVAYENNAKMTINGYGVLPGVFIEEIKQPTSRSRVQPNAYGALRDLDYLMSVSTDERLVKIAWQNKETDETPFDSLVLIDNKNSEGVTYKKISDLTEMLSLALLSTTGQIGNMSKSVGDNVKNDMLNKTFNVENKCAWVSAIGTSAITYDSSQVAKVYELKAQNKLLRELLTHTMDVNTIANNFIDNVRIRENEGKDQVIDRMYAVDEVTPFSLNEKDFDKRTVQQKINTKLDMYFQGFLPSPEDWNKKVDTFFDEVSDKMIEREKELCKQSIGLNIDFLGEVKTQINDIFLQMMRSEMQEQEDDRKIADAELKSQIELLDNYMNKGLFHGKTDNYITLIKTYAQNYLTADLEAKRRSYAIQFYAKMVEFIDKELVNAQDTAKKLKAIVDENEAEIRNIQNHCGNSRTVTIDLAEDVIKSVELKKDDTLSAIMLIDTIPGQTLYVPTTRETYQAVLGKFTANLKECDVIREQTIDDVLNAMSKEDFEDVVRRAANLSKPFLNIDDHGILLKSTNRTLGQEEQFYICVPDVATCRLTKNGYYRDIINSEVAETASTGLTDRIIIYRQKRPVPPLAIGGLDTLRILYDKDSERVSFHFDEQIQQRMDNEDYSFEPKQANLDEAVLAWVMGCILGRIKFDGGLYWFQDDSIKIVTGPEDRWVSTHSAYRDTAFEKFCEREQILKQYIDAFHEHLDAIGKVAAAELEQDVCKNYFQKYSHCQLSKSTIDNSRGYEATKKLISQEQNVLDSIFKR